MTPFLIALQSFLHWVADSYVRMMSRRGLFLALLALGLVLCLSGTLESIEMAHKREPPLPFAGALSCC